MVGILGANSVSGGYEISNSLRFNDGDSPRLTFTPSSAGNRRTFTLSVWFKLGDTVTTGERVLLAADDGTGGNNNFDYIAINGTDRIFVYGYTGSENQQVMTAGLLRDPSAWYHLVFAYDTTQSTAADRVKIYLNGSRVTDIATGNYPSLNLQSKWNNNNAQRISSYPDQDTSYFDGYMAEYHLVDGTAKAPSDFGEFDDNGVWIPKAYTGAYGTNGFYLEFQQTGTGTDASGMGADTSGNDNHFAPVNLAATDVTTDTPTNNFATLNSIIPTAALFSEGNCFVTGGGADTEDRVYSTIAVSTGKWYWEIKKIDNSFQVGIAPQPTDANTNGVNKVGYGANEISYYDGNGYKYINNSGSSYGDAIADGDIVGVALDLDNNKLYFSKNGTFQNSGDPTSGATGTGAISVVAVESNGTGGYVAAGSHNAGGSYNGTAAYNFGNPSFAISSGNADANGYGNFEYAPPSGYYSLCTKNLAEFG
mgnify:CR=1 FL=1